MAALIDNTYVDNTDIRSSDTYIQTQVNMVEIISDFLKLLKKQWPTKQYNDSRFGFNMEFNVFPKNGVSFREFNQVIDNFKKDLQYPNFFTIPNNFEVIEIDKISSIEFFATNFFNIFCDFNECSTQQYKKVGYNTTTALNYELLHYVHNNPSIIKNLESIVSENIFFKDTVFKNMNNSNFIKHFIFAIEDMFIGMFDKNTDPMNFRCIYNYVNESISTNFNCSSVEVGFKCDFDAIENFDNCENKNIQTAWVVNNCELS